MLQQIFKNLFNIFLNLKLFIVESWKEKKPLFLNHEDDLIHLTGLQKSKFFIFDKKTKIFDIDPVKLGALFSSIDIINENGKLVVSKINDDEKTEFYDIMCNINITCENGCFEVTKNFRRITIYRNERGRIVNLIMGEPKVSLEKLPISSNLS